MTCQRAAAGGGGRCPAVARFDRTHRLCAYDAVASALTGRLQSRGGKAPHSLANPAGSQPHPP